MIYPLIHVIIAPMSQPEEGNAIQRVGAGGEVELYGYTEEFGEDAPREVLNKIKNESTYWAIVKKRVGGITAEDYLRYAKRFVDLCNLTYKGTQAKLTVDAAIPLGPVNTFIASAGEFQDNPGSTIDINDLDAAKFKYIFDKSSSVYLRIQPKTESKDSFLSFATVTFTREKPNTLFFYGQAVGENVPSYEHGPFVNLLYKKMFFVKDSAPTLNHRVKLGISSSYDERVGRIPRRSMLG